MKSLLFLYKQKAIGYIRKLFSKPSSTILTLLTVVFFLGLFILMSFATAEISDKAPYEFFVLVFLGFSLFMILIMVFQKRTALFTMTDASFLFVGPYTKKEILTYSCFQSLTSGFLFAFLTYLYTVCFFGGLFVIDAVDYIYLFIVGTSIFILLFMFIDMVYLRFLTSKHQRIIRAGAFIALILIVLSVFIFYYLKNTDLDSFELILSFVTSDLLNYTPIIGWANMALVNMHYGNYLLAFGGLFLILAVAFIFFYIAITTKDIDPEIVLADADWYEKMRERQRKSGSNLNLNLKVKSVKDVKFNTKARAISSRLMLDMRKTNSFITKQELMFIAVYFAIAYFGDYGFTWYSRYVTIILFVITLSANYIDELKHHYIYLLPDTALNKLIAILKPTILKVAIIVLVMNTVGIIFKPTIGEYVAALLETFGYGLVFITANIWSVRILKSNNNDVSNQLIKMFIILLAVAPGILVGILFSLFTNPLLYSYISSLMCIIISCILIYFSKGVLAHEYEAE